MLAEKLFLNILIILAPILVYTAFFEKSRARSFPYLFGLLQGTASSLCLLFSFYALGLYWDLRYVPLVISTLYGGPVAGAINFTMIVLTRIYLGGDALLFGFASISLAFITSLLHYRRFKKIRGRRRIGYSILVSVWPASVMLLVLCSYTFFNKIPNTAGFNPIVGALLFALIQFISVGFASMLLEINLERARMREEIQRTEKLNTMGELAASVAHEIRNPLTVVKGFLQMGL